MTCREGLKYQVADILYAMLHREEREGQEKQGATIRRVRREGGATDCYVISHSLFSLFTSSLRFLSIQELLSLLSLFLLLTV